ncbi:C39 family peptidase [Patescibacteria group bacterium]|nr:C39 family peptidase [Patescibacteria group bacterium]
MISRKVFRAVLAIGGLLVVAMGIFGWRRAHAPAPNVDLPPAQAFETTTSSRGVVPSVGDASGAKPTSSTARAVTATSTNAIPRELRLAVPFLSQAPKKDWSALYEEACEEASVLMVDAYYRDQNTNFTAEAGDKAIVDLVSFEEEMLGAERVSVSAQEMADVANAYFPALQASVLPIHSADDIKKQLTKGIPVIVPADGKALENSHFRNGGPIYHMLLIKGYLPDGRWITNDPGTQFGENFLYSEENLLSSIHDWNGGDVANGAKVMLILRPKTEKK